MGLDEVLFQWGFHECEGRLAQRIPVDVRAALEWVRALISGAANIEGPLLSVARVMNGPWTLLDGLHRAAAWVGHVRTGRCYSMVMNVVVTRSTARPFE